MLDGSLELMRRPSSSLLSRLSICLPTSTFFHHILSPSDVQTKRLNKLSLQLSFFLLFYGRVEGESQIVESKSFRQGRRRFRLGWTQVERSC